MLNLKYLKYLKGKRHCYVSVLGKTEPAEGLHNNTLVALA